MRNLLLNEYIITMITLTLVCRVRLIYAGGGSTLSVCHFSFNDGRLNV